MPRLHGKYDHKLPQTEMQNQEPVDQAHLGEEFKPLARAQMFSLQMGPESVTGRW